MFLAAPLLRAQVVVIDPTAIARNQANQVVNLAKYVQMINNQVQQLNTLTQQLQQTQAYVKAFGDPEQLLNIVGADQLISSLQQTGVGLPRNNHCDKRGHTRRAACVEQNADQCIAFRAPRLQEWADPLRG